MAAQESRIQANNQDQLKVKKTKTKTQNMTLDVAMKIRKDINVVRQA